MQYAAAALFNPARFTLDNGLEVIVIEQPSTLAVAHMLWYKVGGADDFDGQSGLAHLLEHLMFKGSQNVAAGEFSHYVKKHGGRENAFTSYDYTAYFQIVAKEQLDEVMAMEADRMTGLILRSEDIKKERLVVLEERRSRTDNNPRALLSEAVSASLYDNHPYRRPLIGWAHEIESLSKESLSRFYRAYYHPNNAILILSGGITVADAKRLAQKHYGDIPAHSSIERTRKVEPPARASRDVFLRDGRVRKPALSFYWRMKKTRHDAARPSEEAMSLLVHYLGGTEHSQLYKKWVVDERIANSFHLFYDDIGRDYDEVILSYSPAGEMTLENAAQIIRRELQKVAQGDIDTQALERSRAQLLAQAIYAQDSVMTPAYIFGITLTTGGTIEDVELWQARMEAVTADEVRKAARFFAQEPHVRAFLEMDDAS